MDVHQQNATRIQERHAFYQLLCGIEGIELDAFTQAEMRAIVKVAELIIEKEFMSKQYLHNPAETKHFLKMALALEPNELFYGIFLDNKHGIIAHEPLFFGTIDSAAIYPRVVVTRALELRATAIIIAHQHPSGIAEPSDADKRITKRLNEALALVDICLLDHIVIAGTSYKSFSESSLL